MAKFIKAATGGGDPFAKIKSVYSDAVVNIDMSYPRAFGLDTAGSSSATGFIVDKTKGIILTNKHVVTEGPVRAKAKFLKNEEVDLIPIYRDPVHDYGFFKFDPKAVTDTPLVEIKLAPSGAKRGTNVLIIGNNGGEKLSYIESTISRVDRPCVPLLDQNSFYITASDTGVGGSSGGPMINKDGKAVAMVSAGDDSTNMSFYIPLFRAERALKFLREGKPIPRGTIQAAFKHRTLEEVKRYGVPEDILKQMKSAGDGKDFEPLMMTVEKLLPKGPAQSAGMQNGDVLYKINGKLMLTYVDIETIFDSNVGKTAKFEIIRDGKKEHFEIPVHDLENISPNQYVEISNGIITDLQYLVAMHFTIPLDGVFVAKQGYMLRTIPRGSIIKKVGNVDTPNLGAFIDAFKALPNGKLVSVKYIHLLDQNKTHISAVTVDKRWYPFQSALRDDTEGKWILTDCKTSNKEVAGKPVTNPIATGELTTGSDYVGNALVYIEFSTPFALDGNGLSFKWCCGVVFDKAQGLIVCDRNIVSTSLGDVQCTFGASKTISAEVIFVHPIQSFTIVKYDTSLLENDPTVEVSEVKLSDKRVSVGDKVDFVGIQSNQTLFHSSSQIRQIKDVRAEDGDSDDHTFRPLPFEMVSFSGSNGSGAYLEKDTNNVVSLSLSDRFVPMLATDILPTLTACSKAIAAGQEPQKEIMTLPINLKFIPLSEARNVRELSDEWAFKLMKSSDRFQRKVLTVSRRMIGTDSYDKFEENDIILSVNDKPVSLVGKYSELISTSEAVNVKVLRSGEEIDLEGVKTTPFSTVGTSRIVVFSGLVLQEPHPALFYLSSPEKLGNGGIYVNAQEYGSPAENAEYQDIDGSETSTILRKLVFKVDKKEISSLDEFLDAVLKYKHNDYVRLTARNMDNGELSVHNIRLDLEYWKTRDMKRLESGIWNSTFIDHK